MDTLPIELIRDIASVDIQTYHALITAYPRFARDVPAIPIVGKKDRFDYMIDFGFDTRVRKFGHIVFIEWSRYGLTHMNNAPAALQDIGSEYWCQHNKSHRGGDKPAEININGDLGWYQHGKCHRDGDQPAIIRANGSKEWYHHGNLHRDGDKPAVIYANGGREWYQHGKLHRDGNPAIIHADGTVEWYQHDVRQD